jgi:uridine phosphorylase
MEFHIRCAAEDIARYAFVPGDHSRAKSIADHFDQAKLVSTSRGYNVYTGTVDGIRMTVSSTGMGGPSVAIGIEELAHLGVDTFIRVGSCGTMQPYVNCGDVIIATGTFRAGGTANNYLPVEYPAVPDLTVLTALVNAAKKIGVSHHVGVGSAGDAFYAPRDALQQDMLQKAGLVFVEMESDTLFVVSSLRGWRAGAVFACDGTWKETKPDWGEELFRQGEESSIRVAIEAMKAIALADGAIK